MGRGLSWAESTGTRQVHIGGIPTRTLNIDDKYIVDAYGSRITYAITADYALPNAPFNEDRGAIAIKDANGNDLTSTHANAIYAIILPGQDKRGAYSKNGSLLEACPSDASIQAKDNCEHADAVLLECSWAKLIQMINLLPC